MIKTCNISRELISVVTVTQSNVDGVIENGVVLDIVKLQRDRQLLRENEPDYAPTYDGWNLISPLLLKLETLSEIESIHFEEKDQDSFTHFVGFDNNVQDMHGAITDTDVIQAWYRVVELIDYASEIHEKADAIREAMSSSPTE